jgi:hypothetical protein
MKTKRKEYKYSCSTIEVLLWESELEPKPNPGLVSFPAVEGDLAFVGDEKKEFEFKNGQWVEVLPE